MFFRDEDAHLKELLARWTMAFPRVLMCHLREDMDVGKEVAVSGGGGGVARAVLCALVCACVRVGRGWEGAAVQWGRARGCSGWQPALAHPPASPCSTS